METPKTGYQVQSYSVPVKRYCQTLDLRDSPELIAEYRKRQSHVESRSAFHVDWDTATARLNTHPRQQEWEEYMAIFQQAAPGMSSAEKWKPMERMFHL